MSRFDCILQHIHHCIFIGVPVHGDMALYCWYSTMGHLVIFVREIGGLIFLLLTEILTTPTKTPVKNAEREVHIIQMGQNH